MIDLYATLGVARDATQHEIQRAFRQAAFEGHPDRGGDEESFKKKNAAYAVLSDPELRRKYDEAQAAAPGSSAARDALQAFMARLALQLWGQLGAELPEVVRLHEAYRSKDWIGVGEGLFSLLRRAKLGGGGS